MVRKITIILVAFTALFMSTASAQTPTPTPTNTPTATPTTVDNLVQTRDDLVTRAADNINGIAFPRVKPCTGADGTCTDVSSTNPMPVAGSSPAGTITDTNPTIANITSSTCLVANASRKYLLIQDETPGDIMINLTGASLTGVAGTASNVGIVLHSRGFWESPPNFIVTSAITCYQASGASTNSILVHEGQ